MEDIKYFSQHKNLGIACVASIALFNGINLPTTEFINFSSPIEFLLIFWFFLKWRTLTFSNQELLLYASLTIILFTGFLYNLTFSPEYQNIFHERTLTVFMGYFGWLKYLLLFVLLSSLINEMPVATIRQGVLYGLGISALYATFEILCFSLPLLFDLSPPEAAQTLDSFVHKSELDGWARVRVRGLTFEPSYLIVVVGCLFPALLVIDKSWKKRLLNILLFTLFQFFISSPVGIVLLFVSVCFLVSKNRLQFILLQVFGFLVIMLIFYEQLVTITTQIQFTSTLTRIGGWVSAYNVMMSYPIFGVGPGVGAVFAINHSPEFMTKVLNYSEIYDSVVHGEGSAIFSGFLQFILVFGLAGLSVILLYFLANGVMKYSVQDRSRIYVAQCAFISSFNVDGYVFMGFPFVLFLLMHRKL